MSVTPLVIGIVTSSIPRYLRYVDNTLRVSGCIVSETIICLRLVFSAAKNAASAAALAPS